MNKYLNGSIYEMLERAKILKTKIPRLDLPDCFYQLAALVTNEIDLHISSLEYLLKDPKYQIPDNAPTKLTSFQGIVREMDYIENSVVSALNRWRKDDIIITKFVKRICSEIKYPLLPPVASRLSETYYCIDTKFNHLRVPLLEIEFLLHSPDLYHELAHPLLQTKNDPSVAGIRTQLSHFIRFLRLQFDEKIRIERNNGNTLLVEKLQIFKDSWIIGGWATEFFCDLFGIYTLGPAFAWAHLHLCVKRGDEPFETPNFSPSSHPADNARMEAMLIALSLIGFNEDKIKISEYWNQYIIVNGGVKDSDYKWAYPKEILEHCVNNALIGTKSIGCSVVTPNSNGKLYILLNEAWKLFIDNPKEYLKWEKEQSIESMIV